MDENVPRAITGGLRLRGIDVLTVQEDGLSYAHQLHITIGDCVRDLELIARAADPSDLADRVEFLPL